MEGKRLAQFERIVANLPIVPGSLRTGTVPTNRGDILLAWGRSADQQWHGAWCIDRQWRAVARPCEHGWALKEPDVKQAMLNDAYMIASMMDERKLFDPSAKFSETQVGP